jgi:hypothetical protein
MFAARIGSNSGYGVPRSIVAHALGKVAQVPVSTGNCTG